MLQKARIELQPDTLIHNLTTTVHAGVAELNAPARKVWDVVGRFDGYNRFVTGLEYIQMTGTATGPRSLRHKHFTGGDLVVEQLNTRDDEGMTMSWTLIYTTFDIGNMWASMEVVPRGENACTATYRIVGEARSGNPKDQPAFDAFAVGFLKMAMDNLRTMFNGG
ncbi:SRPBCC family protein [Pandoraea bronchicola]|uniref:Polyketide cyclase n=1 Tax=Pandoraea bronchicola TaxID=2508287 RepID=A0A5E5BW03_9BURK|nr:SRPBCC family protein [Pandoraea bronchicola]VVE89195.1 polyketide cyclase [Pandoraea bronchicola]